MERETVEPTTQVQTNRNLERHQKQKLYVRISNNISWMNMAAFIFWKRCGKKLLITWKNEQNQNQNKMYQKRKRKEIKEKYKQRRRKNVEGKWGKKRMLNKWKNEMWLWIACKLKSDTMWFCLCHKQSPQNRQTTPTNLGVNAVVYHKFDAIHIFPPIA